MEMRFQNQMMNVWRRHRIRHAQEIFPVRPAEPGKPRFERVMVDGDIVRYKTILDFVRDISMEYLN